LNNLPHENASWSIIATTSFAIQWCIHLSSLIPLEFAFKVGPFMIESLSHYFLVRDILVPLKVL
jgi:hypothetical protein